MTEQRRSSNDCLAHQAAPLGKLAQDLGKWCMETPASRTKDLAAMKLGQDAEHSLGQRCEPHPQGKAGKTGRTAP